MWYRMQCNANIHMIDIAKCEPKSSYMMEQVQHLLSLLQQEEAWKLLGSNEEGDNPLHSIVQQPHRNKVEVLATLLIHSSVNINSQGKCGMTALHYAVQVHCLTFQYYLLH